jgi:hypothetical protein
MTKAATTEGSLPYRHGRRKTETQTKYKYVIEPLDASVSGNSVKLRTRLTGDFPGSPADLDFKFMLANDKIASLEIG